MSIINIDESYFSDNDLNTTNSTQTKLNIKLNTIDLMLLDELAKKYDDSRSGILNEIISLIVKKFLREEIANFDTRYLLAMLADNINPQKNSNEIEQSWLYEIEPEKQIQELINKYYQYENAHTKEHDDIKTILSINGK